ncbi:exg1 [Symbiodinium sp. CCMP2592]|nr:exg1 [Symbiodinium sp. CCMP2592]
MPMSWTCHEINVEKVCGSGDSFVIRNNVRPSPANTERACLRGVNLGGWLVLEKWMAPDLFAVASSAEDEWTLLSSGGAEAREAVREFRRTFITEQDIRWLKTEGGIDAVRLPVGYWCLDEYAKGTPYLSTQHLVDALFGWAERYGLKVLLDLHGMSGSQNGEHHSGQSGKVNWLEPRHREKNLEIVRAVAARWGHRKALLGLGLGNEVAEKEQTVMDRVASMVSCFTPEYPRSYWVEVARFYAEAAELVEPLLHRDVLLVLDTCWDIDRWTLDKLHGVSGRIVVDYHHYQCMTDEAGSVEEHLQTEELSKILVEQDFRPFPVILGEFSLALKPEAEGYQSRSNWPQQFFQRQVGLAEKHTFGWFFWNYKMAREGWPHWSYRESVEKGWIEPHRFLKQDS